MILKKNGGKGAQAPLDPLVHVHVGDCESVWSYRGAEAGGSSTSRQDCRGIGIGTRAQPPPQSPGPANATSAFLILLTGKKKHLK